jgi:hypothetical protein
LESNSICKFLENGLEKISQVPTGTHRCGCWSVATGEVWYHRLFVTRLCPPRNVVLSYWYRIRKYFYMPTQSWASVDRVEKTYLLYLAFIWWVGKWIPWRNEANGSAKIPVSSLGTVWK